MGIEGKNIAEPAEGCWIHGLWLEGAAWNKPQRYLEDSKGKDLFFAFPNIKVYAECPSPNRRDLVLLKRPPSMTRTCTLAPFTSTLCVKIGTWYPSSTLSLSPQVTTRARKEKVLSAT